MNEHEKAGQPVFQGRMDEVLADRIVDHSQESVRPDTVARDDVPSSPELSEPYQERQRNAPPQRVLFSVTALVIVAIGVAFLVSILGRRKRRN